MLRNRLMKFLFLMLFVSSAMAQSIQIPTKAEKLSMIDSCGSGDGNLYRLAAITRRRYALQHLRRRFLYLPHRRRRTAGWP